MMRNQYPMRYQNSAQEQVDDDYLNKFMQDTKDLLIKPKNPVKSHIKQENKKIYKRRHRQHRDDNDQQRYADGSQLLRHRGKSDTHINRAHNLKQKQKKQQDQIKYQQIFDECCFGHSSDVVAAGLAYQQILDSLKQYIMFKQLQLEVICHHKDKIESVKNFANKIIKNNDHQTNTIHKQNQMILEADETQSRQEIIVLPPKQPNQDNKIIQEVIDESIKWPYEKDFQRNYVRFKDSSNRNSIISAIPYKSIPSLFLIQLLNFIIKMTDQLHIQNYFTQNQKYYTIYQQIHSIAIQSRLYLIEEKLKKGLKHVQQVQNKFKTFYKKDTHPINNSLKTKQTTTDKTDITKNT